MLLIGKQDPTYYSLQEYLAQYFRWGLNLIKINKQKIQRVI